MDWLQRLHRFEDNGVPVYFNPDLPDWFVPSSHTDRLLQALHKQGSIEAAVTSLANGDGAVGRAISRDYHHLASLLASEQVETYRGRSAYLQQGSLKEIWFHVTDTCNLACRHCLFAASPASSMAIERGQLLAAIDEAGDLGSHLFYFTGGEPFVYPDFVGVLAHVLARDSAAHAVVLTNGLLLKEHLHQLLALDTGRLHLQVSLDGMAEAHDFLRGRGSYQQLQDNCAAAREASLAFTVSVAINSGNVDDLPAIAREAHAMGASGLHFMYHFVRGKGSDAQFVEPDYITAQIKETALVCRMLGLRIDNVESLKSQAFSMPGTRHDLSNMGLESIAVGPDGFVYPSPALVRIADLSCGDLRDGLAKIWRQSPVLEKIRRASVIDEGDNEENPLRFLTGGGDPDHSWVNGGSFVGHDPYVVLYEQLLVWLIREQAEQYPDQGCFRLRMGDVRQDCPEVEEAGKDGTVCLTHCNCVISLADHDGHSSVKEFYGSAAREANKDIINPFTPVNEIANFIPEASRTRSYGCGSPVRDAAPQKGETLVDLGSGSGVECFLAAAEVGAQGKVFGIDMTDDMLALARSSQEEVVRDLGYDVLEFCRGYLEDIPLPDANADVVISNCVINLSPDKRRTYLEIMRILKPGGRMVISDIVTDEHISPAIKNSARLRGECLGGAMRQDDLMQMLSDCGFTAVFLHKRYPYRELNGNRFFSLTYEARKAPVEEEGALVRAVYRGPHPFIETAAGRRMEPGRLVHLSEVEAAACDATMFLLDDEGVVTNVEQEPCSCGVASDSVVEKKKSGLRKRAVPLHRHTSGCMVCGAELVYNNDPQERSCHFCGIVETVSSSCRNHHFICDACHQQEGLAVIRHICLTSREKDMSTLVETIRSHPAVPMHGPEHHGMVPGVILAAYRNSGGPISREKITIGIDRGSNVPGGSCGFWGSCGAAIGAGIAAALILDATPLTPHPRQQAQAFTAEILAKISAIQGGRCCQRETLLALRETARLSSAYFGMPLLAKNGIRCSQFRQNRECIRKQCPLWETRLRETGASGMTPLTMAR